MSKYRRRLGLYLGLVDPGADENNAPTRAVQARAVLAVCAALACLVGGLLVLLVAGHHQLGLILIVAGGIGNTVASGLARQRRRRARRRPRPDTANPG